MDGYPTCLYAGWHLPEYAKLNAPHPPRPMDLCGKSPAGWFAVADLDGRSRTPTSSASTRRIACTCGRWLRPRRRDLLRAHHLAVMLAPRRGQRSIHVQCGCGLRAGNDGCDASEYRINEIGGSGIPSQALCRIPMPAPRPRHCWRAGVFVHPSTKPLWRGDRLRISDLDPG